MHSTGCIRAQHDTARTQPSMELTFQNSRGQKIFAQGILPDKPDDIKACFVFCHGYAEHSGRKSPAFRQMAAAGIAVYALDMSGFGQSEGDRALIWNYEHLVDDLCEFAEVARIAHAAKGYPSVPWFLSGFSLGGLFAAHAALRKQEAWQGLVLVSACMWVNMTLLTRLQRLVGPILNFTIPRARIVQKLDPGKDLNPDPDAVADYLADPLVYRDNTAVSTAYQMGEGLFALKARRHQLTLPIYAVHATKDNITPYKDMREFFDATSSSDKTFNSVEGGYHDLIGGKDTEQHVADIVSWVLQHSKVQ